MLQRKIAEIAEGTIQPNPNRRAQSVHVTAPAPKAIAMNGT
jgi:hypothetical protein